MKTPKEIKVLFVTHYRELYGANRSLLQLMLELRQNGVLPTVLLPFGDTSTKDDLTAELDRHGISYTEAPIRIDKHRDWIKAIPNYAMAAIERRKAYQAVRNLNFDIVHSNSSVMSTGAYIAGKAGKPHVWHLREFGRDDYGVRTPFGKWFQKFIYSGRNTFIAISDNIRDHYRKYIGNQEIRRIYNGIDPTSIKEKIRQNERVEICIVGFVRPEKGQMELIKAADDIANRRGLKNFHVTIVGEGEEDYMDIVRNYIDSHGLSDHITVAGRRNDVPDLLAKMDIGVMASTHEAFGRVTIEYMMAGLAVVASDGGANTEIIDDPHTGLIYPSGDSSALADRLEMLISDSDMRIKVAHDGQNHAMAGFSSKANSDAIFSLYKEILVQ